jgi:hypothetical protein
MIDSTYSDDSTLDCANPMPATDIALLLGILGFAFAWHWWKLGWRQAVITVVLLASIVFLHRWFRSIWGAQAWWATATVFLIYLLVAWRVKRVGSFVLWRDRAAK